MMRRKTKEGAAAGFSLIMEKSVLTKLKWLICFSGFMDLFAVAMIYPLLVHRAQELGATPSQVGWFGSIYGTLQLISSPLMGQLSDHIGRRNVMIVAMIGTAISYALLGKAESILFLSLARIPSGLFKHSAAMNKAYIADVIPPEDRSGVFGRFNSISSIGFVIGPTIAGHISMTKNGFTKVAYLSSLIFVLNALFNLYVIPFLLGTPLTQKQTKATGVKENEEKEGLLSAVNGFKDIQKVPWHAVWDVFTIRFLMSFSMIIYRSNFTSILVYKFHTDKLTNGYIQTFNGIVSMASGFCLVYIKSLFRNNDTMHNTFAVILVLSILVLTLSPFLWLYVLTIIPLCMSSSVLRVANTTAIANKGGDETRGLVLGLANTLTSFGRAIGPLVAGYAMHVSYSMPGLCAAFVAFCGTLLAFYSTNSREKTHVE